MTRQVQVKYIDSTWIKRKIYEFATKVGYKAANLKFDKKPVSGYQKVLNWIAYAVMQKKLKDHLGIEPGCVTAIRVGLPWDRIIFDFFMPWGSISSRFTVRRKLRVFP
jgi:hypothetical protein